MIRDLIDKKPNDVLALESSSSVEEGIAALEAITIRVSKRLTEDSSIMMKAQGALASLLGNPPIEKAVNKLDFMKHINSLVNKPGGLDTYMLDLGNHLAENVVTQMPLLASAVSKLDKEIQIGISNNGLSESPYGKKQSVNLQKKVAKIDESLAKFYNYRDNQGMGKLGELYRNAPEILTVRDMLEALPLSLEGQLASIHSTLESINDSADVLLEETLGNKTPKRLAAIKEMGFYMEAIGHYTASMAMYWTELSRFLHIQLANEKLVKKMK